MAELTHEQCETIDLVAMAQQILTAQFQTAQTDPQPVLDDDSDEGLEWWQK